MSTNLTKLASDSAVAQLWQQRADVHSQVGMPAHLLPRWWEARGVRAVGAGGVPWNVFSQLAPGGRRLSVATHHPIGAHGGRLQVDIYDAFDLELESTFTLECGRRIESSSGISYSHVRGTAWLDDAHLVLGFVDGWLRVYDLHGVLCSEARIGANVEDVTCCAGRLAISLFHSQAEHAERNLLAVGIKVFRVERLLAGCFEPELFLPPQGRIASPHSLRLDPGSNVLWALGSRLVPGGQTAWVERIQLPQGRGEHYVTTQNSSRRHWISEVSDDGELVVCTDDEAHLVNRQGETLARLTTRHPLPPRVRPLGSRRYLMAAKGMWLLDFVAQELRPLGPDLGRVSDAWPLAGRSVVAITQRGALCELTRFDPNTAAILAHSHRGPVRHIEDHAFAYDYAGRLHVGDYRGDLHRFDARLHRLAAPSPATGPVQQVVSDPSRKRVGVVGASGVASWVEGNEVTTHSLPDGTPVDPRSGCESVDVTTEDEVFLSSCWPGWRARLGGGLYWKFSARGQVACWQRCDGPPDETGLAHKLVRTFQLPHEQLSRACALAGHPVTVRGDGTLVVYEPAPPTVPAGDANKLPILLPKGTREIARGFDDPIGIIAVGPYEVVVWSAKRIYRVQLDPALTRIVTQRSADSERIGAVIVDPRNEGFVSSHGSHLAFWGPELDERYRLALLEDKSALWHVLHPSDHAHPGWLWREGGFAPWVAALFETSDARGQTVEDHALHEAYIAARFSQSRVELALQDYAAFVRDLAETRQSFAADRLTLQLSG